jgi:hypothetical protein
VLTVQEVYRAFAIDAAAWGITAEELPHSLRDYANKENRE